MCFYRFIIGSLLSRDIQTDHTILQLLLDLADE